MQMKLMCDWFLTDGLLTSVRLGAPMRVMDALLRTGEIQSDDLIVSRMKNEWVFRRTWRYSTRFTPPVSEDKRRFLVLEGLSGAWEWYLNGSLIAKGDAPRAQAEVTGKLLDGENASEIVFLPESSDCLVSACGFFGQMMMRSTGESVISDFRAFVSAEGEVNCLMRVDSAASGEIDFLYTLTSNGNRQTLTVKETVSPGMNDYAHSPFAGIVPGVKAEIALEIRMGETYQDGVRHFMYISETGASYRGFSANDIFTMAFISRAGGNCALGEDSVKNRTLAADRRLSLIADGAADVYAAPPAAQRWETIDEMTGGSPLLFKNNAIIRLSGLPANALDDVFREAGDRAGDYRYVFALSRYMQAVKLRRDAENARRLNRGYVLKDVRTLAPQPVSGALFDADERPRPAYFALQDAWKKEHAFSVMPDRIPDDGICAVPVYYLADERNGIATVCARAFAFSGRELVSANFPVLSSGADPVGRLCVEMPEDGLVIIRTSVIRNGETVSSSDMLYASGEGKIPSLSDTQILIRESAVENVGSVAAVGVTVPGADYFGILLPGESVQIPKGKPNRAESLNGIY